MRKLLVAASAFAFSATALPAVAQPSAQDALDAVDFGAAAQMLERVVDAVMDLPVGGIAAAVDPLGRGGIYPHDTLGSVSRRNDPGAERRIRDNIRGAARTAETTSRAVARLMPVLERSLDELSRGVADAVAAARSE